MTSFLQVGSPTVSPVPNGPGWLVDVGELVPLVLPNADLAYEVAASFVPPAGDVEREEPAHDFATPGGRGSTRPHPTRAAVLPDGDPRPGERVSESLTLNSPEDDDSGTTHTPAVESVVSA